jgi:hypothetical protein
VDSAEKGTWSVENPVEKTSENFYRPPPCKVCRWPALTDFYSPLATQVPVRVCHACFRALFEAREAELERGERAYKDRAA